MFYSVSITVVLWDKHRNSWYTLSMVPKVQCTLVLHRTVGCSVVLLLTTLGDLRLPVGTADADATFIL